MKIKKLVSLNKLLNHFILIDNFFFSKQNNSENFHYVS
ncbi:MAG: Uncharacterised protein [Crocinitomicaceae bacterium]|nr:MAG: Uncharacterised protein [Crocinitomicaceae bacterium]